MNKKNFLIASFLFFSIWAGAQTTEKRTTFGLTAGYSNIKFNANEGYPLFSVDKNPGINDNFFIGAFAEIQLNPKTLFKPEVSHIFTKESNGYLEVSPLFKYHLFNSGFNVFGGPQLRYITGSVSDNYKRLGFGLTAGLGYDFNKFSMQARYSYEFTNRYKDDVAPTDGLKMHLEVFSVGVGYKF